MGRVARRREEERRREKGEREREGEEERKRSRSAEKRGSLSLALNRDQRQLPRLFEWPLFPLSTEISIPPSRQRRETGRKHAPTSSEKQENTCRSTQRGPFSPSPSTATNHDDDDNDNERRPRSFARPTPSYAFGRFHPFLRISRSRSTSSWL